jgi:hypothetical protein
MPSAKALENLVATLHEGHRLVIHAAQQPAVIAASKGLPNESTPRILSRGKGSNRWENDATAQSGLDTVDRRGDARCLRSVEHTP